MLECISRIDQQEILYSSLRLKIRNRPQMNTDKTDQSYGCILICVICVNLWLVLLLACLQIVAAPKKQTVRVMSYNIHVGVGMDQKLDLERIAEVINKARPDLVALQEVDRGVRRTQGLDEIAELSRLTKMDYAFAHNIDYQGGEYGVAILSRFPIEKIDHVKFEDRRESV